LCGSLRWHRDSRRARRKRIDQQQCRHDQPGHHDRARGPEEHTPGLHVQRLAFACDHRDPKGHEADDAEGDVNAERQSIDGGHDVFPSIAAGSRR
jgi:hypothetical protein